MLVDRLGRRPILLSGAVVVRLLCQVLSNGMVNFRADGCFTWSYRLVDVHRRTGDTERGRNLCYHLQRCVRIQVRVHCRFRVDCLFI